MVKLLKKLLKCPADRDLILVWSEVVGEYGLGQTHTATRIYIGRYVALRWTKVHMPRIGGNC